MIPSPPSDDTYRRCFTAAAELLVLQVKQVPTGWAEVGGDEGLLDICAACCKPVDISQLIWQTAFYKRTILLRSRFRAAPRTLNTSRVELKLEEPRRHLLRVCWNFKREADLARPLEGANGSLQWRG